MLRRAPRGFTLIELLLGVALLAVLLMLGAPALGTYLQNSKLASATGNYYAGVQMARAEAIRRNIQTQFVLTDTPLATADIANSLAPTPVGKSWVVRAASDPAATVFLPALDMKDAAEGSGSALAPAIQISTAASGAPANGQIAFTGFGRPFPPTATYWIDIKNPAAGACVLDGGPVRCRRIVVSPGGQVTACDPAATSTDSRWCGPPGP